MIGQLTTEQVEDVLRSNILGRIGCRDGDKIYVVPITYLYDGRAIIGHSLEGMKIRLMRKYPQICFEVDEVKSFSNWRSVVAWGEYQELTTERDRYQAMKLFVDRMIHLKISETARPPELNEIRMHPRSAGQMKPVVFRILLTEKTGRFENKAD